MKKDTTTTTSSGYGSILLHPIIISASSSDNNPTSGEEQQRRQQQETSSSSNNNSQHPETQPLLASFARKISEPFLYGLLHGNDNDGDADYSNQHTTTASNLSTIVRKLSEPLLQDLDIIRNSSFALNLLDNNDTEHNHAKSGFHGTATVLSEVANMTKNLIGGGVLSLSGGIAVYSNNPQAIFPAMLWTTLFGAILGYFCLLIGKSCQMTYSSTYRECWERTVGHRGGLLVAIANTLDPLLGIFANATILSQSLRLLLLGGLSIEWSTTTCLLIITVVAIAPLCLMKNLDALAPYSALGMVAVLCALGAMMVRYFDGSYLEDGLYAEDTPPELSPSFGTDPTPWCSLTLLPFICMVYTSFDMHYNSPRFYSELQDASVPRFTHVVSYSFGITAAIYSAIGVVGFLTFGENSDSYILNNYSPRDSLATLARLAIGLCSLVSYPLNFIGVRDNMLDILGVADQVNTPSKLNAFTLLLLAVLTITSCFVSDLGMINSVGGGTTVTLVCFIFPALMFQEGTRHVGGGFEGGSRGQTRRRREQWLVMVLTVIGVVVGVVGVWASLFYGA